MEELLGLHWKIASLLRIFLFQMIDYILNIQDDPLNFTADVISASLFNIQHNYWLSVIYLRFGEEWQPYREG